MAKGHSLSWTALVWHAGGKTAVKVATLGLAGKDGKKDGDSNKKESYKEPKVADQAMCMQPVLSMLV